MSLLKKALYELIFTLYVLLYFPKWLWDYTVYGKYRKSLLKRLGFGIKTLSNDDSFCIWIHAASVGEAKAAKPLCKRLKKKLPDAKIIFSSVTETGYDEVKKNNPYVYKQIYLPIDFSWTAKKLVRAIHPNLFMLIESEFWPNLLNEIQRHNCPIYLMNGKISDRSYKRFRKLPFLKKLFFDPITHFCVQTKNYADRFQSLGIEPSQISITGNLKYDIEDKLLSEKEIGLLKNRLGILKHHKVITIGSTHKGEEKLLLNALKPILKDRHYKIIIAPRHLERFFELKKLLEEMHVHYLIYSKPETADRFEKVIAIDEMGILNSCYQIADVAIVGGSFVPVGGHNLLEPARYGIPVFFGPFTFNQENMKHLLVQNKLGKKCDLTLLASAISDYFTNDAECKKIKDRSQELVSSIRGAATKSVEKILLKDSF